MRKTPYNRLNVDKKLRRLMMELRAVRSAAQQHDDLRTVIYLDVAVGSLDSIRLHLNEEIFHRKQEAAR